MLKLDEKRYCELSWKNPRPESSNALPQQELGNMEGASNPETEDGLFWDMLTDLAKLLREEDNR